MDWTKNFIAIISTGLAWMVSLSIHEIISFALASLLTVCTIAFVVVGVINRVKDGKIKDEVLKREKAKNETY